MKYLTGEDILVLHALVIDESGGSHGVRDTHLLASLVQKPQTSFNGKDLYRGVFEKAAAFLEAIVNYHVFVDGNKRTGLISVSRFLAVNGYEFVATNSEAEAMVIAVAVKTLKEKELVLWLKKHSKRAKK